MYCQKQLNLRKNRTKNVRNVDNVETARIQICVLDVVLNMWINLENFIERYMYASIKNPMSKTKAK